MHHFQFRYEEAYGSYAHQDFNQYGSWTLENAVVRTASLVTNSDGDKYDDVVDEDRAVGDVSVDGIGEEVGCLSEGHATSPSLLSWHTNLAGLRCPPVQA